MELTRPPMSEAARNRLERRMYPKGNSYPKNMHDKPENGLKAGHGKGEAYALPWEGMELDIAAEKLREAETSRGWATRQVRTLHKEMRRCHLFLPHVNIFSHTSFSTQLPALIPEVSHKG